MSIICNFFYLMLVTKKNYSILLNNLEKFRKNTILRNIDYSEINCEIIKNDSNKINKNKKDEKNISG